VDIAGLRKRVTDSASVTLTGLATALEVSSQASTSLKAEIMELHVKSLRSWESWEPAIRNLLSENPDQFQSALVHLRTEVATSLLSVRARLDSQEETTSSLYAQLEELGHELTTSLPKLGKSLTTILEERLASISEDLDRLKRRVRR